MDMVLVAFLAGVFVVVVEAVVFVVLARLAVVLSAVFVVLARLAVVLAAVFVVLARLAAVLVAVACLPAACLLAGSAVDLLVAARFDGARVDVAFAALFFEPEDLGDVAFAALFFEPEDLGDAAAFFFAAAIRWHLPADVNAGL